MKLDTTDIRVRHMDDAAVAEDFFAQRLREIATPIIDRADAELLADANSHSDPAVREHAAFEYMARYGRGAFPVVLKLWEGEEDKRVRISLFEELARLDRVGFGKYLEYNDVPDDVVPIAVAQYNAPMEQARVTRSDPDELFQQVIPLRISLREFVETKPGVWKYHVFAPIQETRVAGQLYACSRVDTRSNKIILTKQLQGLHSDGSLHLENTCFRGRMVWTGERSAVFSFATAMPVPFYPSGRIGDESEGVVPDAVINVERGGSLAFDDNLTIENEPAIRNVTGIIRAWGYTRPDRATFDPQGRMDQIAGLFHLGSLIEPRIVDYVNTYTVGTYRGVIMEDEDGVIGLNTNPSYSTLDGEIDTDRDGVPDQPGLHYDRCPGIHPIEHYASAGSTPQQ